MFSNRKNALKQVLISIAEDLQRYFGRFGEVIDCVVMKNSESGRSRGFGFVTFADPANVDVVLRSGPHVLDSRTVSTLVMRKNFIPFDKSSYDSHSGMYRCDCK